MKKLIFYQKLWPIWTSNIKIFLALFYPDTEGYTNVKEYFPQEKLFDKVDADITSLFKFIRSLDGEKIKIRNTFPQIFEIIDKSPLNDEAKVQFIDLIKNSESTEYSQILNNLSTIRRIHESIFQSINKTNKDIIPDELFKDNGDIKFWDIHRHLKGNVKEINLRRMEDHHTRILFRDN